MAFLIGTCTLTSGSAAVTLDGGVNAGFVYPGSAIFFRVASGTALREGIAGAIGSITLRDAWDEATEASVAFSVIYTSEGIRDANIAMRDALALIDDIQVNPVADSISRRDASGKINAVAGTTGDNVLTHANKTTSSTDTTAGRLLKVGDFGLGGNANSAPNDDLNDIIVAGIYDITGTTLNRPASLVPTNGLLFHMSRTSLLSCQIAQARRSNQIFIRYLDATWSAWQEIYHTGNLNVNEFGGIAINDNVAVGTAANSTTARFYLPILSYTAPVSITVTSLFSVLRDGQAVLFSGLTPALLAATSNKLAIIDIAGLSGLVVGENLVLRTDDATSKITVNF